MHRSLSCSRQRTSTAYDDPKIGRDPQPPGMDSYFDTSSDNRGAHINSGIPNQVFYIIAAELCGNSGNKTNTVITMARDTDFSNFAMTIRAGGTIYGDGSAELKAFQKGW
jgi:Zn-dependent metalloprotease